MDGHTLLCRLKVAAGLAMLAGRRAMTADDWRLAATVMQVSAVTHRWMVEHVKAVDTKDAVERGIHNGVASDAADEAKEERRVQRIADGLLGRLDGEWVPRSDLRKTISGRDRPVFDAAIERLITAKQVARAGNDGDGVSYRKQQLR